MADQCMRWDVAERPSFSLLLVALINFMQDFCVLGRPNLTTDIQDHLFRFFWLLCFGQQFNNKMQFSQSCKSSEKESLRETRQADERRRAKKGVLGRLGGKTEDGKRGAEKRRRKGKGMSSLLSSVQSPWHPFRHSYLAASAHPARQCQQMDHAWCVWRQASHAFYAFPKHFC